jgi:hypothetical protein
MARMELLMASVYRETTGEFIGYYIDLYGPAPFISTSFDLRAYRHSNGEIGWGPEAPVDMHGRRNPIRPETISIRVSHIEEPDIHMHIPENLIELFLKHPKFRPFQRPSGQTAA